jgi:hypothetical protein
MTCRNMRLYIQAIKSFDSKHMGLRTKIITRAKFCKPGNKDNVNRRESNTLVNLLEEHKQRDDNKDVQWGQRFSFTNRCTFY